MAVKYTSLINLRLTKNSQIGIFGMQMYVPSGSHGGRPPFLEPDNPDYKSGRRCFDFSNIFADIFSEKHRRF
jgi:hypothetical protein